MNAVDCCIQTIQFRAALFPSFQLTQKFPSWAIQTIRTANPFFVEVHVFFGQCFALLVLLLEVLIGFFHVAGNPLAKLANEFVEFLDNLFGIREEMNCSSTLKVSK